MLGCYVPMAGRFAREQLPSGLLTKLFLHIEADRGYWLGESERLIGTVR